MGDVKDKKQPAPVTHDPVRPSYLDTTRDIKDKLAPANASKRIDEILAGASRDVLSLPALVADLEPAERAALGPRIGDFAKVVSGRILFEVATLTSAAPVDVLHAMTPATTEPAELRVYLAGQDLAPLLTITGLPLLKVRATLRGAFLDELPALASNVAAIAAHAGFVRWWIETTPPGVLAVQMESASDTLAETLDREQLWGWLDHVHALRGGAAFLLRTTQDPVARQKLDALVSPLSRGLSAAADAAYRKQHAHDVDRALAQPASGEELAGAIGRQRAVAPGQASHVLDELRARQAPADDVLSLIASNVITNPFAIEPALRVLLAAPGVTALHLSTFVRAQPVVAGLHDAALVAELRRGLGSAHRLSDLVDRNAPTHAVLVDREPLRAWFLDGARPHDLLWFAVSDVGRAALASRAVGERHPDWRWVEQLTSAEDAVALHRLALHCPDHHAQAYIRETLLGDSVLAPDGPVQGAVAPDPSVYGGERARLEHELENPVDVQHHGGKDVIARVADLGEVERAELGTHHDEVAELGRHVGADDFARLAHLLALSVEATILGSPGRSTRTVSYLATRPDAERLVALAQPALVERAASHVSGDLLMIFPALAEPAQLAAALHRMPQLLALLLEGGDPSRVVALLAHDLVRPHAEAILAADPRALAHVPGYAQLSRRGQVGIDRLEHDAAASGPAHAALEHIHADQTGASKADRASLDEAVAVDQIGIFAVLDARRADVVALLGDPGRGDLVDRIAGRTGLPPDVMCPFIAIDQLLALPLARRWWFHDRIDPAALLHRIRGVGIGHVASDLSANAPHARRWLEALPSGPGLTDDELRILDQIQPQLLDAGTLRTLFRIRFGMPSPDAYGLADTRALYTTVARLPSAHLRQQRITRFVELDTGFSGQWAEGSKEVRIGPTARPGQRFDHYHSHDAGQPGHAWLSRAEMHADYGFDDATLEAQVRAGNIEHDGDRFRAAEVVIDEFTSTVLHEIGHSVDEVLGKRTPPVYGFAAWREHTFDSWATEMGGWEKVSTEDRQQITDAWIEAARANAPLKSLVGASHPILAKKYADVGLIKLTIDAATNVKYRAEHGGRTYRGSGGEFFYSLSTAAAQSAPTDYATTAPAEYFAESYVEYYRGVDGKPDSAKRKGGGLPTPVKAWFDANVDKLRFDPARFKDEA
jgi:hypothetical protein